MRNKDEPERKSVSGMVGMPETRSQMKIAHARGDNRPGHQPVRTGASCSIGAGS